MEERYGKEGGKIRGKERINRVQLLRKKNENGKWIYTYGGGEGERERQREWGRRKKGG